MSHDEECCLKTALAFTVLRKRLENNTSRPAFVGGLLENSNFPTLPPSEHAQNTPHLQKMMQVAISTAASFLSSSSKNDTSYATLEGICTHLALQLRNDTVWSLPWIQETLVSKQILAVSTVWHSILNQDSSLGAKLLLVVGQVLQDLYHNEQEDVAVQMVKLVQLAEACLSIRLSTTPPLVLMGELQQAMGPELCLAIPTKDLAYFVLRNSASGKAGNKILLRFFLYDMVEKLSACAAQQQK